MAGQASRRGEQSLVDIYEGKIKDLATRKKELQKNKNK